MESIVLKNGFQKLEYGFKKVTSNEVSSIEHFITLYPPNKVQLFAFCGDEDEKIYDTSIVEMTPDILQTFISVLVK